MVLCYVDDVISIGHKPGIVMDGVQEMFKLKDDKIGPPDMYLGAQLQRVTSSESTPCWTMSSEKYIKNSIKTVKDKLAK